MALLEFKTLYTPNLGFCEHPKRLVVFDQAKQFIVLARLQLQREPGSFQDVSTVPLKS